MNRISKAILLGTSLAAFGCSRDEPAPRAEVSAADVRQQPNTPTDTAPLYVQQERDRFVRAAQQELDQLKSQLASLDGQAQAASGEAKARLTAQVTELRTQLAAAEARLAELNAAGVEKWREAQASIAAEIRDLKQSFERSRRERDQG